MAIRQHKNYKFNFTLADGSIKTITHSVPLPVASEIGCEDVVIESKQYTFPEDRVTISANQQKRLDFQAPEGYLFDINKIDNYIIKIKGTQITENDAFIYKPLSTQDLIVLIINNKYNEQQQVDVELTTYICEPPITNVQDNLDYLYAEVSKNTQQTNINAENIQNIQNNLKINTSRNATFQIQYQPDTVQSEIKVKVKLGEYRYLEKRVDENGVHYDISARVDLPADEIPIKNIEPEITEDEKELSIVLKTKSGNDWSNKANYTITISAYCAIRTETIKETIDLLSRHLEATGNIIIIQ